MSRNIPGGTALPLELSLPDGVTSKFPQAHVYNDDTDIEVAGSPFDLPHVALGMYKSSPFTPGSNGRYRAKYITYNNAGHTLESAKYGRVDEIFEVNNIISEVSAIKGTVDTNLDATISSRNSTTHFDAVIGTPVGTVSSDIAEVESDIDLVKAQTDQLSFTGGNVNANSQVVSDKTGYALTTGEKDDIVDRVWDELLTPHSTPDSAGKILEDMGPEVSAIKTVTDQFTFTGPNVNANAQVVSDKTDYILSSAEKDFLVDLIWDEVLSDHLTAGSTGKALSDADTVSGAATVAAAVWDALVSAHTIPNTFGDYVQVIRQTCFDVQDEVVNPTHGLLAIINEVMNRAIALTGEVNQNEVKIDALTPFIVGVKNDVIAEVNQNEVKIDALSSQADTNKNTIVAEVNQNEVKIDSLAAQVGTIQNNTTTRFVVPEQIVRPDSGTKDYQFHLRLYDESGNAEAPDSTPTIRIRRLDTLVDIVIGAAMTQDGVKVGAYFYVFTISSGTNLYPLLVEATVVEGGKTRYVPAVSEIIEFSSELASIEAQLTTIESETSDIQTKVNNPTYGLSALKASQDNLLLEIDQNEVKIDLIQAKTDNLPASPASSSEVAAVTTAVLTRPTISDIQGRLDILRDNIKGIDNRDITQVYNVFDLTPVAKTSDPRFAHLDADISSRSTLTAAQVWAYATRTLTTLDLPNSEVKKIWDYLTSAATVSGSLGKRVADFLDAAVSTRATAAQVTAALAGVAQEATLLAAQGALTTEINQNEVKINSIQTDTTAIKGKTNNLPATPASETTVISETNAIDAAIATLQLVANGIKAKTDNLPPDPAHQSSVLTIPTNPLRDNDARLNRLDVNVSTRSSLGTSDLAPLAKTTDVTAAKNQIISEVDQNEVKIDTVNTKVTAIKAKTDNLPSDPARESTVVSSKDEVLNAIDNIPGGGGGLTAAQVWAHSPRTLTSIIEPDLSAVAKSAELVPLAKTQYVNRMSTAFNNIAGTQEIIAWAEKDGQRVSGTNCIVTVKDSSGGVAWTASLPTPSADGIFKFVQPITPVPDLDYYVVISIVVDGTPRINNQPFFTVG